MSHKSIVQLIEDVSRSLGDNIKFVYGRDSDFNKEENKPETTIVLGLLSSSPVYTDNDVFNYTKSWSIRLGFYQRDTQQSTQEEFKKILDYTDELLDKFVNKLNFYSQQSDNIVLSGIEQTPFVKAMADILTGHILEFNLQVNDNFNYCGLDDC